MCLHMVLACDGRMDGRTDGQTGERTDGAAYTQITLYITQLSATKSILDFPSCRIQYTCVCSASEAVSGCAL